MDPILAAILLALGGGAVVYHKKKKDTCKPVEALFGLTFHPDGGSESEQLNETRTLPLGAGRVQESTALFQLMATIVPKHIKQDTPAGMWRVRKWEVAQDQTKCPLTFSKGKVLGMQYVDPKDPHNSSLPTFGT